MTRYAFPGEHSDPAVVHPSSSDKRISHPGMTLREFYISQFGPAFIGRLDFDSLANGTREDMKNFIDLLYLFVDAVIRHENKEKK